MRQTTKRPEAIEAGVAKLVGINRESIINSVEVLLKDAVEYRRMASHANPFWEGKASERTVSFLANEWKLKAKSSKVPIFWLYFQSNLKERIDKLKN